MVPLEFLIRKANQKKKQVNSEIVVEQTKTFTRFSFIFALANPTGSLIKESKIKKSNNYVGPKFGVKVAKFRRKNKNIID